MKKLTIEVKVKLLLYVDETADLDEVMDDMDYEFVAASAGAATVIDTEMTDYKVVDSR